MISAFIVWSLLATCVIGLALYRKFVAHYREDDLLHVSPGEEKLVSQQIEVAGTLDKVDHLGKILTLITAVSGLILLVIYLYGVYLDGLKPVA